MSPGVIMRGALALIRPAAALGSLRARAGGGAPRPRRAEVRRDGDARGRAGAPRASGAPGLPLPVSRPHGPAVPALRPLDERRGDRAPPPRRRARGKSARRRPRALRPRAARAAPGAACAASGGPPDRPRGELALRAAPVLVHLTPGRDMTEPSYQQPAYQPPAGTGPSGPRASFGRRLVAAIIDGILLGIVGGIFYAISTTLGYIVQILVTVAYLTYLEGSPSGQTVGN